MSQLYGLLELELIIRFFLIKVGLGQIWEKKTEQVKDVNACKPDKSEAQKQLKHTGNLSCPWFNKIKRGSAVSSVIDGVGKFSSEYSCCKSKV